MEIKELRKYIQEVMNEASHSVEAIKFERVHVRKATPGEVVDTYSLAGRFEQSQVAEKGDYVLTLLDKDQQPIITTGMKTITWVVHPSVLYRDYEYTMFDDVFMSCDTVRTLIEIPENVIIALDNLQQINLCRGDYLDITKMSGVEKVSKDRFELLYHILRRW